MADDQGTQVAPQDQAKATEPKKPEPQDNGSETPNSTATPQQASKGADAKDSEKSGKKDGKDGKDASSGRGAGLHR